MSNIQNIDMSLQEIVKNISKNTYLIPKFQRDFVWNNNDIIELGDSIIRGYPISSLLIMAENGSLNVSSHGLVKDSIKESSDNDNDDDIRFYVLDGQQRLTSISKLFLNLDQKNEYYFDLLSILIEKYPNDKIQSDSGLQQTIKSKVTEIFCRNFPLSKDKSEKPTRQNNRFISGKSIVENRFGSVVNKFLREFKDASDENLDKYTDYLNAVFGAVGGYSIPATVIARDSELGVVIRVFEKVNSTGKKLTLFDLINAKSFQTENITYKGGLSDYLTQSIFNQTSQKATDREAINIFLKFNEQNNSFDKLDRIIRIFEICNLLKNNMNPSIFQSTMLEKKSDFWFESWDSYSKKFIKVLSWLKKEGLFNIGQTTYVEYIIAILLAEDKAFKINSFTTKIKDYAFYLSLSGTSFNKSNLDTVEKIFAIATSMSNKHPVNDDLSYSLNMSESNILQITPSNKKFNAIINSLYIDKLDAKFTKDILGNSIKHDDVSDLDKHHIFPKSKVPDYSANSEFNSIANYVLLGIFENREILKDKTPKEYFSELEKDPKVEFNLTQNLIDISEIKNIDNEIQAKAFIQNRANKIAKLLNSKYTTSQP